MEVRINTADPAQILALIESIQFPELRGATPMDMAYARKLHALATNFELWDNEALVGLFSVYMNDFENMTVHASLYGVQEAYRGHGVKLMRAMARRAGAEGFRQLMATDVDADNLRAVELYKKFGRGATITETTDRRVSIRADFDEYFRRAGKSAKP